MFSLIALTTLALSVSAAPAKRDIISDCPVGTSLLSIASFTMTAVYNSDTSVQLPLSLGNATRSGGLDVLATTASITNPKGSTFGMDNRAIGLFSGQTLLETGNNVTGLGSFLSFSPDSTPAEIYCALVNTDPNGGTGTPLFLGIGDSAEFSICHTPNGLDAVIWQPQLGGESGAYDFSTCQSVTVGIVEN